MKKVRRCTEVILLLVFAISLTVILRRAFDQRRAAEDASDAAQLAGLTGQEIIEPSGGYEEASGEGPYDGPLAGLNLDALQAVNEDVAGWVEIPDTPLSYPLVQGEDNQFYLNHSWKKEPGSVGAVFLEQANSRDLTGFHILIYGHRMRDGTMFGSLRGYKEQDYWQEHPSVYLADKGGVRRYDIFAAHEAKVNGMVYYLDMEDHGLEEEFIQYCMERSVIDTGIVPKADDQILTLSTCTARGYKARWVVHAVLAQEFASHSNAKSKTP